MDGGIGRTWGVLMGINTVEIVGTGYLLVCYWENDTLNYSNELFETCLPTGTLSLGNDQNLEMTDGHNMPVEFYQTNENLEVRINDKVNTSNSVVRFYNIKGMLIFKQLLHGKRQFQVDKTALNTGIYIIVGNVDHAVFSQKIFIRQKITSN